MSLRQSRSLSGEKLFHAQKRQIYKKTLDKSACLVYNSFVRRDTPYSKSNKCVDGCVSAPYPKPTFSESCRQVQGSKALVYDPPVADELNTVRSTAGKFVRISTVKGKCIDGCTEADFGFILCPLTTRKEGIFCFSCSSAPAKPENSSRKTAGGVLL